MTASRDSTSWSVVFGTARGVPEAQVRFHERYEALIRAYLAARWRLDRAHERVANATQEVFLRCLAPGGALQRVDPARPAGFRAYLLGVVTNVAQEVERQDRRHHAVRLDATDSGVDVADPVQSASIAFDRAWAELLLCEAWGVVAERLLRKPSGPQRLQVLRMRYLEDLPPEEIRQQLGLADLRDVYRIAATGRYQFRIALQQTVASYYPELDPAAVEAKCRQLVELI